MSQANHKVLPLRYSEQFPVHQSTARGEAFVLVRLSSDLASFLKPGESPLHLTCAVGSAGGGLRS